LLDFCAPSNLKIVLDEDEEDDPADYARRVLETSAALASRFLVVGGGAFQGLWSASKGSMGFGGAPPQRPQALHHSQLAGVIPAELANRFASPILSLRPMEAKDYQGMLRIALRKMPSDIRKVIKQRAGNSLQAAVAHGLGCRWIEQLVLEASISGHKRMVRRNKNHVIKDTLTLKTPQPS
jgi:hypothetical protein